MESSPHRDQLVTALERVIEELLYTSQVAVGHGLASLPVPRDGRGALVGRARALTASPRGEARGSGALQMAKAPEATGARARRARR